MRQKDRGFTTVEVLIVWSTLSIILLGGFTFLMTLWSGGEAAQVRGDTNTQAELALTVISQELRHGTRSSAGSPPNVSIPAEPDNTQLTFYMPTDVDGNGYIVDASGNVEWDTGNPIVFQFDADDSQVQRVEGADVHVLANDVTAVTFEDASIDPTLGDNEVRITVTVQKSTSRGVVLPATVTGMVRLRN